MLADARARSALSVLQYGADAVLAAALAPACAACGSVLDRPTAGPVCAACWTAARVTDGRYEGALRAIIHAFKYEGRASLGAPLGALLRARAADVLSGAAAAVPVPLHPLRRLRRGFNQASVLAAQLQLPVVQALWRVRWTPPQAGLSAPARARNVRGAFRLSPVLGAPARALLAGRVVVIVDDVRTTGSTIDACADALTAAGPREIRRLTLATAALRDHATS